MKARSSSSKRNGMVFIIVGGRGTGKTTFLKKNVAKHDNAVVFQLFKTDYECPQYFFKETTKIDERFVNKRIIIEDATQLIASNSTKFIKELVVSSKQLGSDVYLVFHSINSIPPFLYSMFNVIILFMCVKPVKTSNNIEYYDEIVSKIPRYKYNYNVLQSKIN